MLYEYKRRGTEGIREGFKEEANPMLEGGIRMPDGEWKCRLDNSMEVSKRVFTGLGQ